MSVIQSQAAAPAPGRKTVLHILCVVLALVLSVVPALAVVLPEAKPEDGNTVIGTFITSSIPDYSKDRLREWLASDRNLLIKDNTGSYCFITIPAGVTVSVAKNSLGLADITFRGGDSVGVYFQGWESSAPEFNGSGPMTIYDGGGPKGCIIVSGTIFDSANITLPIPTSSYLAEFEGNLLLRDDGGLFGAGGEGGWWQGLLDWLASFWDKLKDFFIGLFIPEKGYFEKWVADIRAAASEKLGPVVDFYDTLSLLFKTIQDDSGPPKELIISLPPNFLYQGYKGVKTDLMPVIRPYAAYIKPILSSIILLVSGVVCYKRLVVLFEQ